MLYAHAYPSFLVRSQKIRLFSDLFMGECWLLTWILGVFEFKNVDHYVGNSYVHVHMHSPAGDGMCLQPCLFLNRHSGGVLSGSIWAILSEWLILSMVHLVRRTYALIQVGTKRWCHVCCVPQVTTACVTLMRPSILVSLFLQRNSSQKWARVDNALLS